MGPEPEVGKGRANGGSGAPDLGMSDPYADLTFPGLDPVARMMAEYDQLRFSADLHPLTPLRDSLPDDVVRSDRLAALHRGSEIKVAGIVTTRQRPGTAKGYVFILMEDEGGPVNVIVRPPVYERCRNAVRLEPFLVVRGTLKKDGATYNVVARRIDALGVALGTDGGTARRQSTNESPFRYLTALRRDPPGIKSWG